MSNIASPSLLGKPQGLLNVQQTPAFDMITNRNIHTPQHVDSSVSNYLSRRHYGLKHSEMFKRKPTSTHSLKEMALRQVVEIETSLNDCFQFSTDGCTDPRLIEQQYTKFKLLISESPDHYKPELAQLLYPIFTHLYLELVNSGKKADAQKFHKKHQTTFLGNTEFAQFIRRLTPITTIEDVYRDDVVSAYYNSRYSVTLSNKTFFYLMKYLYSQYHSNQNGNSIILLQILRTKVDIKLSDALGACSKSEAVQNVKNDLESVVDETISSNASHCTLDNSKKTLPSDQNHAMDANMERLNQIINAVHENGPIPLPSTSLYKLFSDSLSTTSSTISEDFGMMALGCENSSVLVWDLLPSTSTLGNPEQISSEGEHYNPSAHIPLGCDKSKVPREKTRSHKNDIFNNKITLLGHSGPVYDVSFVPSVVQKESKNLLLSVSRDKTMRLWNPSENMNISVYKGHTYPVWSVDVDRLGINVATGSMDKTAKLWQLEYTHPIRMYAGHEADVDIVKFHPNCNYLATGSSDKTVRLWTHADAKMVRVFTGNTAGIYSLAFSPNGKFLASGGEDRILRIWDIGSSMLVKELKGHTDIIYSLVWSKDSSLLASSGLDGSVRLWDVKSIGNKASESSLVTGLETNGPSKFNTTGDVLDNPRKTIVSPELKACYPTTCSNILNLVYSPHNTLVATGIISSASISNGTMGGISGSTSLASSTIPVNKSVASLGISVPVSVSAAHSQNSSVGFTKIFINGAGNSCHK